MMSEKFRLDRKIGFQNTFYTKCINVIIDSIGPSIILRSIYANCLIYIYMNIDINIRMKRKIAEKIKGYTYKITNISDANCPRVANLSLCITLLPSWQI